MRKLFGISGAAVIASALALSAHAHGYGAEGASVDEVAEALQDAGYRAEIGVDNVGDPMVTTSMSGYEVVVLMYNCGGERCEDIQFRSGFDMDNGISSERVNEWNRTKRFGAVYRDEEDDPILTYDIQVGPGGTPEMIAGTATTFDQVLAAFLDHIDFN